ncbi:MAG TPA: UdgX family uracil-DNA binding protein [Burkholderiaceae bacterium]|nr:UdgX family uracil-DNA binding protein [Burkholderiaceae bacterium]
MTPPAHRPDAATGVGSLAVPDAGDDLHARERVWLQQRDLAATCRGCPLFAHATQTVWGEGPVGAALMLVGEQPGDQEDRQGRPIVRPAGQLLDRALHDLGWDRSIAYVTNAVKHFKWVPAPRGKRRMHKTPAQREADACEHWLEAEIALVQPQAIVAMGATAAHQLLKRPVPVLRERGHWLVRADGRKVLVTLHPSALLRVDPADREPAYRAWLADLHLAGGFARVHATP